MPVTLTRTDYRLDEVVELGTLAFPDAPGYSVQIYRDFEASSEENPAPVLTGPPEPADEWRWGRFPAVDYSGHATAVTLDMFIGVSRFIFALQENRPGEFFRTGRFWWDPVEGVFPVGAVLRLLRAGHATVTARVTGFAPLRFNPDTEIAAARPAIEAGIGVRWPAPYSDEGVFTPWEDVRPAGSQAPPGFVYCHPVLEPSDALTAILAGVGSPSADMAVEFAGGRDLQNLPAFANVRQIFAQRLTDDTAVARQVATEGRDRSYSERRIEFVSRAAVSQGMGVMVERRLFFVETAERLGRTGFHRFTAVRRYQQETV